MTHTRVRLPNAYVRQRHLAGDVKTPIALLERTVAALRDRRDEAAPPAKGDAPGFDG